MEYLTLIISFIVGGGLSTLVNLKLSKRTSKLDYADRAIQFAEKQSDGLMKRVNNMEAELKLLSKFKCEKIDCKTRIPQV